jgi:hypothetical protein
MDYYYLLSSNLLGICGVLAFSWAALFKKTRWLFFFVPAVLSFTRLSHMDVQGLGFGVHWFNYVFAFLVIMAVRKKRYLYIDYKIIISLLVFLAFATALSMVVSIDRIRSLGRAMTLSLVLLVGIYTIPSIGNINRDSSNQHLNLHSFIWGIVFWFSIPVVLFALFYGAKSLQGNLGSSHFIISGYRIDRLQRGDLGTNAAGFGYGIGIGVLYSFLGFIISTSTRKRLRYFIMLLASTFLLFLTQTRSAMVGVCGAIVFWVMMSYKKPKTKIRIILIAGIAVVLAICFQDYIMAFFGRGGKSYASIFDVIYQSRGARWMALMEEARNTLFYGFGLGNDRGYWNHLSGDNSCLVMMIQVGFIGLCLYLVSVSAVVYNSFRWDKNPIMNKEQFPPISPYVVYIVIISLFSDALAVPNETVPLFFALGVLAKPHHIFNKKTPLSNQIYEEMS